MNLCPSSKYGTILVLSNLTTQRSKNEKSCLGLQWGVRLQTSTDAPATLARMTNVSVRGVSIRGPLNYPPQTIALPGRYQMLRSLNLLIRLSPQRNEPQKSHQIFLFL